MGAFRKTITDLPAAVKVVKLALGHGIIDINGRNFELAQFVHLDNIRESISLKEKLLN